MLSILSYSDGHTDNGSCRIFIVMKFTNFVKKTELYENSVHLFSRSVFSTF